MSTPTIEDGFFEGVYDYNPHLQQAYDPEEVQRAMPNRGRWDLTDARPAVLGFPDGVDQHLGNLGLPYRQTNEVMQVGLQYVHDQPNRTAVPDGYEVLFARMGRFRDTHVQKSLVVSVLRESVATDLLETEPTNDAQHRWQRVAQVGERIGNAVLSWSAHTQANRGLITRNSKRSYTAPAPADEKLAQATFRTVAFWE
ncbi:MAG TPA: hypothetical protein VK694_06620 [Verrucomicrobiae bacterium]|nr:hypothetical protein [Verrucomicrobiae bacterium]